MMANMLMGVVGSCGGRIHEFVNSAKRRGFGEQRNVETRPRKKSSTMLAKCWQTKEKKRKTI